MGNKKKVIRKEAKKYQEIPPIFNVHGFLSMTESKGKIEQARKVHLLNLDQNISPLSLKNDINFLFYEVIPIYITAIYLNLHRRVVITGVDFCSQKKGEEKFDAILRTNDGEKISIQCVRAINKDEEHNRSKQQELLEECGIAPAGSQKILASKTRAGGRKPNSGDNIPQFQVLDEEGLVKRGIEYILNAIKDKSVTLKGDWLIVTIDSYGWSIKVFPHLFKKICQEVHKQIFSKDSLNFKRIFIINHDYICSGNNLCNLFPQPNKRIEVSKYVYEIPL